MIAISVRRLKDAEKAWEKLGKASVCESCGQPTQRSCKRCGQRICRADAKDHPRRNYEEPQEMWRKCD